MLGIYSSQQDTQNLDILEQYTQVAKVQWDYLIGFVISFLQNLVRLPETIVDIQHPLMKDLDQRMNGRQQDLRLHRQQDLRLRQQQDLRFRRQQDLRLHRQQDLRFRRQQNLRLHRQQYLRLRRQQDLRLQ